MIQAPNIKPDLKFWTFVFLFLAFLTAIIFLLKGWTDSVEGILILFAILLILAAAYCYLSAGKDNDT